MSKRTLKPEQAAAAHTLDRHVSVTAGPGSGKTTVLVERYLHILRENKQLGIDQIVAITFTNRAANEMRERLRKELDAILASCDAKDRPRWMRYKRTLDGAIINTIHGFCARLLREFPVEASVDPQFLLLDQHDAAILLEAAVEETLTELISKGREKISQLALGFGRGKLAAALVQLYNNVRGQGLTLDELAERTKESHANLDTYNEAVRQLEQRMAEFFNRRLTRAAEEKRLRAELAWPALRKQLERIPTPAEMRDYCTAIEDFREFRIDRGVLGDLVVQLDSLLWGDVNKRPRYCGLVPLICFDISAREYALEVIDVLGQVEQRYSEKKQNLAALDFEDLQLRALKLLDNLAVLARTTERYRFFLVDEFQDTNSVQRELMHKLALRSTTARANLFIVGDRKQSIYGFRGADVAVFQQTTAELVAAGGVEQPLHLNFRSRLPLITFFNRLFKPLFEPPEEVHRGQLAELGFVEFEPSVKAEPDEDNDASIQPRDDSPLVELLIDTKAISADQDNPKAQRDAAERDALQVAHRIISLTHGEETHQYREIALLFRALTDVNVYEAVLRKNNIPFQTVQGKGFYDRDEISDLIQLLRFLDNKTDELALAAILRSPLGGLSDNALLALRCAPRLADVDDENESRLLNQPRPLLYAIRHHHEIAFIDDDDRAQLDRIGVLLNKLIERRNHYPIADLLRYAVEESEYMTVIAANFDGAQRLANVRKLFTLAERFERAGAHLVRDFVRYVEEFEAIGSREGEGQIDDSANAVTLMTIHQAKGLEFPIVFIPNLHHRSVRSQEHWFALDRHRGLTVKIPDGRGQQVAGLTLETFRDRSKHREYAESIRLLYVAATRAENRLILSGVTDTLDKLNGATDNWLKLIWQKLPLQVSQSGLVDLGDDAQLNVTLNLAEQELTAVNAPAPTEEQTPELPASLISAFPLLSQIAGEPRGTDRFSVTQLINYQRCPRQYYFDRVLHVPSADEMAVWNNAEAPEPPANLTATMKGAVIHRFCETYQRGDNAEEQLRKSFTEVVSARRAQLADRLLDINIEQAVADLWPLAQNYLSSEVFARIDALRKVSPLISTGSPGSEPGIWSELSFRLRRPNGFITGTIDKLLITPAENGNGLQIEIIDFKTNRLAQAKTAAVSTHVKEIPPARSSKKNKGPSNQFAFDFSAPVDTGRRPDPVDFLDVAAQVAILATDYQLQMQAYALAVRQLLPHSDISIRATLHFLHPNVELSLPDELLRQSVCEEVLDQAMLQLAHSVSPVEFPVVPAVHCRTCSFLDACYAGRQWLRDNRRQKLGAGVN